MTTAQRVSDIRTQIYLPEAWHQQLQAVASQKGLSMAAVIRNSIGKTLGIKPQSTTKISEKEKTRAWRRLMKLSGITKGKDEPGDVSTRPGYYWAKAIEEKLKQRGAL